MDAQRAKFLRDKGDGKLHKHAIMQFTYWKQKIMDKLASDKELTKLLAYNSDDALVRPDLTEDERYDLIGKRILGVRYLSKVVQDQQSMIGIGFGNFVPQESWRQFSEKFTMGYVYFYILVDNEIMSMETGYRQDLILARVYDLFQDEKFFGIGTLELGNLTELWEQNNKFGGYCLMMRVIDTK